MKISFENLFHSLPGYCFIKDKKSQYIYANNNFLRLINMEQQSLLYKNDYQMPWANVDADKYRQDDKKVLHGEKLLNYIESQTRAHVTTYVRVNKIPLIEQGEIIGLTCQFYDYGIDNNIQLSSRQQSCLQYLVKGFTAKEIAKALKLSVRTVEYYIEIIKDKFNCKNKAELIYKASTLTFLK